MKRVLQGLIQIIRPRRNADEALQPLLGVAEPPQVFHAWYVPLSPVEDEELAWELDRERRKGMENNA